MTYSTVSSPDKFLPTDLATSTNIAPSLYNSKSIGGKKKATTYKKKIDKIKEWLNSMKKKTYKNGSKTMKRRKTMRR